MITKRNLFIIIALLLITLLIVYWLARKASCDINNFKFYLPDELFNATYTDNNGQMKTVNNSDVVDSIVTISIILALFILFRNLNK